MRLRSTSKDLATNLDLPDEGAPERDSRAWLRVAPTPQTGLNDATPVKLASDRPELLRQTGEEFAGEAFALLPFGDNRIHPSVSAAFETESPMAQSLRGLRGLVAAQRRVEGHPIRSLAVLSIDAETEATLVAANLSVVFAQAGYSTLLVDANTEQPSVHALFRTANRGGLIDLLDRPEDERALSQVTAIPTLSVLTAGRQAPNAIELLERNKLSRVMAPLYDLFDYVIVDASRAGLKAPIITDELDAAIVVVRQHVSAMGSLQQLVAAVQDRGTQVLGAIVAT